MSAVQFMESMEWPVKRLEELSISIQYGYTAKAKDDKVGPRFLRITDIQNDQVDWSTVPSCDIGDVELPKYLLHPGDIVFARTGATVGKSYLIRGSIPQTVFASYLIRVRLNNDVDPRFVAFFSVRWIIGVRLLRTNQELGNQTLMEKSLRIFESLLPR